MNEEVLEAITTKMVDLSSDFGFANQLLVSSLVKYLVDKQIIDLDDYLQHNQETQEYLLKVLNDETEKILLRNSFKNTERIFKNQNKYKALSPDRLYIGANDENFHLENEHGSVCQHSPCGQ